MGLALAPDKLRQLAPLLLFLFYCPPDFTSRPRCADCRADTKGHFNCLSVGNKQSMCLLMWGHKRKVWGTSKIFGAPAYGPHLQIATDATEAGLGIGGESYWAGRASARPLLGHCGPPLYLGRPLFRMKHHALVC